MDPFKETLGVMTMVYQDYFFLERWYRYYGAQVGPQNLFIYSHGGDPKHKEIAPEANVINVPRDPGMVKLERRRWRMQGYAASGLLDFYNWMIVGDVDEIVIVDPTRAEGLCAYLAGTFPDKSAAPLNISPLGIEIIHLPEKEPLPLEDAATILSRRQHFKVSRSYSKPCLVGQPAIFAPGGHRNNGGPRHLSDDLFLLHLRFVDFGMLEARIEKRRAMLDRAQAENAQYEKAHVWDSTMREYQGFAGLDVRGEDVTLAAERAALGKQFERYANQYVPGRGTFDALYKLPDRFKNVF
ncbi:MAG: glycosyltransferase family 2 protein [Pseudomonadota bacterium]